MAFRETTVDLIDFRRPANGFANALHLWPACHDRIERVVSLVERLPRHLEAHGPDESARLTGGEVRRFFEQAVPRHHADEDDDRFPLVLRRAREAQPNGEADAAARRIERLSAEHHALSASWLGVREMLNAIERQTSRAIDQMLVGDLVRPQLEHHAAEDRIIRPFAQRLLTPQDRGPLGTVMAARRGAVWSGLACSQ
jgi:hypothetical protein